MAPIHVYCKHVTTLNRQSFAFQIDNGFSVHNPMHKCRRHKSSIVLHSPPVVSVVADIAEHQKHRNIAYTFRQSIQKNPQVFCSPLLSVVVRDLDYIAPPQEYLMCLPQFLDYGGGSVWKPPTSKKFQHFNSQS